jgi:putative transposase
MTDPHSSVPVDWPHAPVHRFSTRGSCMITAGTWQKGWLLNTPPKRDLVLSLLFEHAGSMGLQLQAWAILANHYHLIALVDESPEKMRAWMKVFHNETSTALNELDATPGRTVWYQYWDTRSPISELTSRD